MPTFGIPLAGAGRVRQGAMGDDHRSHSVAACAVPAGLAGLAYRQCFCDTGEPDRRAAHPARSVATLARTAVAGAQRDVLDDDFAGMA